MTLETYITIQTALNAQSHKFFQDLARAERLGCDESVAFWQAEIDKNFKAMNEIRSMSFSA